MSILFDKSSKSIESAKLLFDQCLYHSSIHCCYYSCIQLMRHILFTKLKYDEVVYDNSNEVKAKNSHEVLINKIWANYHTTAGANNFKKDILALKKYRVNADYKQIQMKKNDGIDAFNYAQKITDNLNDNFQL